MKQNIMINEPLGSKVKWKESLDRTASFNKKGSSSSISKFEKIENSDNIKSNDKNNLDLKTKESKKIIYKILNVKLMNLVP